MALLLGNLVERFGPRRLLVGLMAALPPALAAYAYAPNLALSSVALFVGGGAVPRSALDLLDDRPAARAGRVSAAASYR